MLFSVSFMRAGFMPVIPHLSPEPSTVPHTWSAYGINVCQVDEWELGASRVGDKNGNP